MTKYVLYIDRNATAKVPYEYRELTAQNITDAMIEADKMMQDDPYYLIRIMEKSGKVKPVDGCSGWKQVPYKAVFCSRSHGWHPNTAEYSEGTHWAVKKYCKTCSYIECI